MYKILVILKIIWRYSIRETGVKTMQNKEELYFRPDLFESIDQHFEKMMQGKHGHIIFLAGMLGSGRTITLKMIYHQFRRQYKNPLIIGGYFSKAQFISWKDKEKQKKIIEKSIEGAGLVISIFSFIGALISVGVVSSELIADFRKESQNDYFGLMEKTLLHSERPIVCFLDNLNEVEISWWSDLLLKLAPKVAIDAKILFVLGVEGPNELWADEKYESKFLHTAQKMIERHQAVWWPLLPLSREVVASWIGFAASDVIQQIYDITQGYPEWIEQLWEFWKKNGTVYYKNPEDRWTFNSEKKANWLNPVDDILIERCQNILGSTELDNFDELRQWLSLAALEGPTFTANALAELLGRQPDDLINYFDDEMVQSDESPDGLLIDLDPITIMDKYSIPHYLCRYHFSADLFWMIFDRYGITNQDERVKRSKEMAEILIRLYVPEEDRIAATLARLFKYVGDKERTQQYQRMSDYSQNIDLSYQQAMIIINSPKDDWNDWDYQWAIGLLSALSKKMKYHFSFLECELILKEAYDLAAKHYGPEFDTTIECLSVLGIFYFEYGRYGEAEPLLKWALEIRERVYGMDHHTAASLNNLAVLYDKQGRHEEAEPLYKRALEIRERVYGMDPTTLNNLAELYRSQGRYEEAEPLYKKVLEIFERVLGANHLNTARTLSNLAILYDNQGRYEEAEPLHKRALEIFERGLGANHPNMASLLNNLAELYREQGRYDVAELLYKRSLEIYERVLEVDHPNTATFLNNLALLYNNQGRYEEAEPLYKRALEINERMLGADHQSTAISLKNLILFYDNQGQYEEAEPLYKRALEIFERVLGADHPDTVVSLNNLANLYYKQDRYEEAEPLYKRELEIKERALGVDHPDTANSLNNLASLYNKQGRYKEAELLYKRVLEIRERVQRADHPHTATSLNNLAFFYENQGRYEEAEQLYKRALEIRERVLGVDHPDTAQSLNNLGLFYDNQGRYEEAKSLYKRALEICKKVLGKEHPNTQICLKNLVKLFESRNQTAAAQEVMRRFAE